MSVVAKPFVASQELYQRIFAGRPALICAEDLNQIETALITAINQIGNSLGPVRANWQIVPTYTTNTPPSGMIGNLQINAITGGGSFVYANNVQYQIPVGATNYAFNNSANPSVVYVYLIATKTTITFADNPTVAGIMGTAFPTAQPSSNAVVWGNERIAVVNNKSAISLGLNEYIICLLARIVPQKRSTVVSNVVQSSWSFGIEYNAATLEDLVAQFPPDSDVLFEDNSSVIDVFLQFFDQYEEAKTLDEATLSVVGTNLTGALSAIATLETEVGTLNTVISAFGATLTSLQNQVNTLNTYTGGNNYGTPKIIANNDNYQTALTKLDKAPFVATYSNNTIVTCTDTGNPIFTLSSGVSISSAMGLTIMFCGQILTNGSAASTIHFNINVNGTSVGSGIGVDYPLTTGYGICICLFATVSGYTSGSSITVTGTTGSGGTTCGIGSNIMTLFALDAK